MSLPSTGWTTRPLDGWVIGISVANSDDLASRGYTPEDVNRATVRLCEAVLSARARLVFGHDWRPDGIMDAISRIAVKFQPPPPERSSPLPLIQNLLPWPTQPVEEIKLRWELEQRGILKVQTFGLPEGEWNSPTDPLAIAISLTHMRRELAKRTHARVCLGGKVQSSQGFFAGIVEEAYNAAIAGQPVYVGSFLGGAAAELVSALEHPQQAPVLQVLESQKTAYGLVRDKSPSLVPEEDLAPGLTPEILQRQSGLSPEDWQSLLNAPDIEAFSTLVIRGLSQLPNPGITDTANPKSSPLMVNPPPPKKAATRSSRRKA